MNYLLWIGVPVVLTLFVLSWWFSAAEKGKRKLRSEPAVPAMSLLPGQVAKVSGSVVLEEVLRAPLSGVACAYWRIVVEERQGKNSWRTAGERSRQVPFLLDDGSGQLVRVAPFDATLIVNLELAGRTGLFDDPSAKELEALRQCGLGATVLGFNKHYRLKEATLRADELVSVLGTVNLRETANGAEIVLFAPPGGELIVSDARGVHA